jgi:hypothetical protein
MLCLNHQMLCLNHPRLRMADIMKELLCVSARSVSASYSLVGKSHVLTWAEREIFISFWFRLLNILSCWRALQSHKWVYKLSFNRPFPHFSRSVASGWCIHAKTGESHGLSLAPISCSLIGLFHWSFSLIISNSMSCSMMVIIASSKSTDGKDNRGIISMMANLSTK